MARISVIVVTYYTGPVLFETLDTLLADPDADEIILVDNGNSNLTRDMISAVKSDRIRILQGHGNIGFSAGCNYGAAMSGGEFIAFINPDARPMAGALAALCEVASQSPFPHIAGAVLFGEDGTEQRGSRRSTLTLPKFIGAMIGWDRFNLHKSRLPDAPFSVGAVSGAGMMLSRKSFDALGGFDEGYFLHVEDIDLCRRAIKMGGQVTCVPDAKVVHIGATSKTSSLFVSAHKTHGFLRYFWKHSGDVGKIFTVIFAPLILFVTMVRGLLA
ncbi:glycosyltransferase family 2 protein [Robiginitomaculum antarcticum]|uniref:glycosyltransferase family 2 protein n=1 Tax=Robiginitomaculum antarcticum TaxID=437507 RepID=UPI00037A5516|nr:glycosyltransferase family 2 protein [Robiginitomaculum antarcticum]